MSVTNVAGDRFRGKRAFGKGEIIAFRAWRVIEGGPWPILKSFSFPYVWSPGVNDCKKEADLRSYIHVDGPVPTSDNHCGFYALKDYNRILDYWGISKDWYCLGAVEMWGEVIEGELGYRAEFAAVQNIVALVRAGRKTPRVINGTVAWKQALKQSFNSYGFKTMDKQAGVPAREFDNQGKLITELREVYVR